MIIWHNPRCSKSRECISSLNDLGIDFDIREYLEDKPSKEEILEVIKLLKITDVKDMMRVTEQNFIDMNLENASNEELVEAMSKCPKLIQRPLAITAHGAAIGRPFDKIIDLINEDHT